MSINRAAAGKRIEEWRKSISPKLTQGDLADQIAKCKGGDVSFSRSLISEYENGQKIPSGLFLSFIGERYDVSADYILFGRGALHLVPENHPINSLSENELQRIERVNRLDDQNKKLIYDVIDACLTTHGL